MEKQTRDFPHDPVVKSLPSNAGDMGSISSRGTQFSQAAEQLSLDTTATEAGV